MKCRNNEEYIDISIIGARCSVIEVSGPTIEPRPPSDAFLLHPRLLRDNSRNDPEAEATVVRWPGRLRFFYIVVEEAALAAWERVWVRDKLSRQIARDPIKAPRLALAIAIART